MAGRLPASSRLRHVVVRLGERLAPGAARFRVRLAPIATRFRDRTPASLGPVLDRVAGTAERLTLRQVLAALLAVVLVATLALGVVITRESRQPESRWAAADAAVTTDPATHPATSPPPARQAPQPGVAGLEPSPPAWRLADPSGEFTEWAIVDRPGTAVVDVSRGARQASTTASMIKAWIAADYLRRSSEAGQQPSQARLDELTLVIRDSDNAYAQSIFHELGAHQSIERLIEICGLKDSRAVPYRWSNTQMSPLDAALMGACLADGRAAGPEWTAWLLDEMRAVRGLGDFGIRQAFPPEERSRIAIKNGWVIRDTLAEWHVNCLAIGDGWTMAVMTRYPARLGYEHGAGICESLSAEHLADLR